MSDERKDWQIEDVLAILDGNGITITDDKQVTRTLHAHGLMRMTPVAEHEEALAALREAALGDLRAKDERQSYWLDRALQAEGKLKDVREKVDRAIDEQQLERALRGLYDLPLPPQEESRS